MKTHNGDVFDIGQTVNGVSKFLYYNDKWFYYSERITREYEYSHEDLTKLLHDDKMNVVVAFAEIDEDCNSYVQAKTKLI
jgi:hypothetical protein